MQSDNIQALYHGHEVTIRDPHVVLLLCLGKLCLLLAQIAHNRQRDTDSLSCQVQSGNMQALSHGLEVMILRLHVI